MTNKMFLARLAKEKKFYQEECSKKRFGVFHHLVGDFIGDHRYKDYWERRIFPMLDSVQSGKSFGEDWTDFIWGSACFRKDHVMFLDASIHQMDRRFPPILDEIGNPIVDEGGQWLENTEFIEEHYSEFTKIPLDEFIEICRKWYDEVIS